MTEIKFRDDLKVSYVQHMGGDEMMARAARVSTNKDKVKQDKIAGLIGYLVRENHTSPSEHNVLTVRVEAPLSAARQWERHRTQSYSELSLRFSMAQPEFYIPGGERPLMNEGSGAHPSLVKHPEQRHVQQKMVRRRKALYQEDWDEYIWEIENDIAEEVARDVLPLGFYTKFYATANLNNWFKFLTLRNGEKGAPQWEIVQGARQVEKVIENTWPITYAAWKAL